MLVYFGNRVHGLKVLFSLSFIYIDNPVFDS